MRTRDALLGFVCLIGFSATAASGATLLVDDSGQLTGATGVDVGGSLYDVEFVDGSCADLFDGCDDTSDFDFQSESDAIAANQALIDQVLIDVFAGSFDSDPETTLGCDNLYSCLILTPYEVTDRASSNVNASYSFNSTGSDKVHSPLFIGPDYDSATGGNLSPSNYVYAKFTIATVPSPASLPLLLAGLGGLIAFGRRAKHRQPAARNQF